MSTTLDAGPSPLRRDDPDGPVGGPATDAAAPTSRVSAVLAVLVVLVGIVLAPPRAPVLGAGEVVLRSGPLEVAAGSGWDTVTLGQRLGPGARLRAGGAEVVLAVAGGTARLAPGSALTLGADEDELTAGAVLLEVDRLRRVRLGAVTAAGEGAWRVDAAPATRVAVYTGGAGVDGARDVALGPLSQSVLAGVDVGAEAPLTYLASDPWDARLAAEPLAVDRAAAALTTSLAALYGTQPQTAAFYGDFVAVDEGLEAALAELAPRATADGRVGPPAPVLLGVVTVRLLVERAALAPADALAEVLATRRAGGTWGVVVVRRDLGADDLRAAADAALRRRAQDQAAGVAAPLIGTPPAGPVDLPAPGVPTPVAPGPGRPGRPGPTPPTDGDGGGGGGGDDDEPGPVGGLVGTVRDLETGVGPVDTTLDELLDPVEGVGRSVDELLRPGVTERILD
ncbi:MAG: hypothetical protein ACLGIR_09720 [Actinomycetes bacterium]